MQPSTPTPNPEQPKQGFWAKLFGKKPKPAVVPPHESHTPPPQLGNDGTDTPEQPVNGGPAVGADAGSQSGDVPVSGETAAPSGGEGEQLPPTLDVPGSVEGVSAEENTGVPPSLPTQPPQDSTEQSSAVPPVPDTNDLPPVAPPSSPPPQEPPVSGDDQVK